jgi:hypothetical protein
VTHINECANHRLGIRLVHFLLNGLQTDQQLSWQRGPWREPGPFSGCGISLFLRNDSAEANDLARVRGGIFRRIDPDAGTVHSFRFEQRAQRLLQEIMANLTFGRSTGYPDAWLARRMCLPPNPHELASMASSRDLPGLAA